MYTFYNEVLRSSSCVGNEYNAKSEQIFEIKYYYKLYIHHYILSLPVCPIGTHGMTKIFYLKSIEIFKREY